jgi:hypothetical protein
MLFRGLEGAMYPFWVAVFSITAIIHLAFARGVLRDSEMKQRYNGEYTYFVNIWIWALSTLNPYQAPRT